MGNKIQRKRQQDRRRAHANRSTSPLFDNLEGFTPIPNVYQQTAADVRAVDPFWGALQVQVRETGEPVLLAVQKPAAPRGRCGECGTRHKLRKGDGTLSTHPRGIEHTCSGSGTAPVDEPVE